MVSATEEAVFEQQRNEMVLKQIQNRGIRHPQILAAFRETPRHLFVPQACQKSAYADSPLKIGLDQTISQPYIVAYMLSELSVQKTDRVLEIGTGSGYQTAVLAKICKSVYTVEVLPKLAYSAKKILIRLGFKNIQYRIADGNLGWEKAAPFNKIIVSAAPKSIPTALVNQIAENGKLILPVGDKTQSLVLLTKTEQGTQLSTKIGVRFVPMRSLE